MKRFLLAMMVLGSAPALIAQTETLRERPPFQPAEALSVTDVAFPISSIASGTVVLDALITETGKIQAVEVRRDIASLTQPSVRTVEHWKFSPATFAGKAIVSRVPVAVTFRPPVWYAEPVSLPGLIPQSAAEVQAKFQPAGVIRAAFPKYPFNTVAEGTVVLDVTLSAAGKAEEVKVLSDLPPLTAEAKAVVGEWRFTPAAYNGKPVRSKIILAFVFSQIVSSS